PVEGVAIYGRVDDDGRRAAEIEVADQGRRLPRGLGVGGGLRHRDADALEHLLDGDAGGLDGLDQLGGIEAVAAGAVGGDVAGGGGVGDERAFRRVDLGE